MMASLRGLALLHSAGNMHYGLPSSLTWFGQGAVAGIPVPVIIAFLFALFGAWLFNHTRFGLHVRAIGGNREAARLAGVPVNRIELMVYALMGLITALGGLIMIARIDSTQATIGTSMEIHVIAAVIIGGTSLFGGRGTVYGTVLGALLLSMMTNALVIAGRGLLLAARGDGRDRPHRGRHQQPARASRFGARDLPAVLVRGPHVVQQPRELYPC